MPASLPDLLARFPSLEECVPDIQAAYELLEGCYAAGGKVLACGNGGSAADCEHIVGELMKGFLSRRPVPAEVRGRLLEQFPGEGEYLADNLQGGLPAISLVSQSGLLTAYGNDVDFEMAFAQQVYGYGREGDLLIAISTSGTSRNVVNAVRVARAQGLATLGFTGSGGGHLAELCDVTIRVPREETSFIQELHLPIYHFLCANLEQTFFPAEAEEDRQ